MITPSFGLTATERVLPKLALDFTTASLDSRVTFTRTTGASNPATYVNSNGVITTATNNQPRFDYDPVTLVCKGLLIEESRQNLLIRSQEFNVNAPWVPTRCSISADVVTSPDGTSNADKLVIDTTTNTTHRINYSAGYNAGTYTATVFAKKAEKDYLILQLNTVANGLAWFNLATGTLGTKQAGLASSSITSFGNGWYRCSVTATLATGTTDLVIYPGEVDNVTTIVNGDGTSGIYLWGAQLEAGAFATSYIPTTSAALTRNADNAQMSGTNFSDWYNISEGTYAYEYIRGAAASSGGGRVFASGVSGSNSYGVFTAAATSTQDYLYIRDISGDAVAAAVFSATANGISKFAVGYKVNDFAWASNGASPATDTSGVVPSQSNELRLGRAINTNGSYLNSHLRKLEYWPQRLTNNEVRAFSK